MTDQRFSVSNTGRMAFWRLVFAGREKGEGLWAVEIDTSPGMFLNPFEWAYCL